MTAESSAAARPVVPVAALQFCGLQCLDREGQKIDTQHRYPKLEHVLGVLLAEKQDFPGAAEHMRTYLKFAPDAQDAGMVKKQLTEIEKLSSAGKLTPNPAPAPQPQP